MMLLRRAACIRYGYGMETNAVLGRVLKGSPGSIRALAREAGVSHGLLVQIRDGGRRLTPETRRRLATALRRWSETCEELADDLEEDCTPEPQGGAR